MSVLPTESNISMVGVGLLGRTTSGAGKSSRLNAASVRSFCSVYSTSEVDALLAGKSNSSHTHAQSDVTGLVSALAAKADLVGGLVPSSQLPSYVDDVIEGANLAAFPVSGETGKIYVALDTGKTYRWSGSAYVELTDATAVWGSISGTLSNQTDLSAALTARALTTTTISAGTGLSGGGDLSANRSLSVVYGTTAGTACQGNDSRLSDARTPTAHNQAWSTITSTPTTLAGYGITDAQPLDSDLTAIAALTTTAFGRSVLTQADGPAIRTLIGAGTSSFDGAYASLSGIPSSFTPSSHTHTAANITDFGEAVDDEVATLLQAGSGITLTYNDAANTLTIAASGGGSGSPAGANTQIQFNDSGAFGGSSALTFNKTTTALTLTQAVQTSGSPTLLTITGAAHTTLTASTEATDVDLNLARTVQFATGALTTQRAVRIQAPTYAFVTASTLSYATTFNVSGAPIAGTNATLSDRTAISVGVNGTSSNFASISLLGNGSVNGWIDLRGPSQTFGQYGLFYDFVTDSTALYGHLTRTVTIGHMSISRTYTPGWFFTANTLEQRNSTNAQTLNIYGTYTSTTSLERLSIKHTLTQVEIGQQKGSAGGSDRPIVLGHYGSGSTITAAITIATNGVVTLAQTPSIPGYASNARAFAMGLIF